MKIIQCYIISEENLSNVSKITILALFCLITLSWYSFPSLDVFDKELKSSCSSSLGC